VANGKIISVRAVKTELKDGKDLLADFVMVNTYLEMIATHYLNNSMFLISRKSYK
jgi:hypothetical protein